MRKGYTHIAVVLDESGSMGSLRRSTIESFNKFLNEQQQEPGEVTITLVKFNSLVQPQYHFKGVNDPSVALTEETYNPSGTTALYDAEGWTIEYTGRRLAEWNEDARPEKVIIVIITDGQENASTDFTREKVEALIKQQEEVYKWQFIFLGSNHSATEQARSVGISVASAMTYAPTDAGTRQVYSSMSAQISKMRRDPLKSASFSLDERLLQQSLGAVDDDLNGTRPNAPPVATSNRNSRRS